MQNLQLPSFFLMSSTGEAQGDSLAWIFKEDKKSFFLIFTFEVEEFCEKISKDLPSDSYRVL